LWKEYITLSLSLEDRLVFFFKKDSLKAKFWGIGSALFKALSIPFFIYITREPMGISGTSSDNASYVMLAKIGDVFDNRYSAIKLDS